MRLRALSCAASAALTIAACGSSGPSARDQKPPPTNATPPKAPRTQRHTLRLATNPAERTRALQHLRSARGYRFTLTGSLNAPDLGGVMTASGSGTFDRRTDSSAMLLDVQPPGILGVLGEVESHVTVTRGDVYIEMPDSLDGRPIGGEPYAHASFAEIEQNFRIGGPSTLAHLIDRLVTDPTGRVWIDGSGRLAEVEGSSRGGDIRRLTVTIRITHYGCEQPAKVPPPDQVTDLAAVATRLGL